MVKRLVPLFPAIVAFLTLGVVSLAGVVELSFAAKAFAIGGGAASMLAAVLLRRADVRAHASVCLAAGSMVASGQAPHDAAFMLMTAPFLAAAIAALRVPRTGERTGRGPRPPRFVDRHVPARSQGPLALALAVGAVVAAGLVATLPPASRAVEAQVDKLFTGNIEVEQRVGFSSRLRLGSTTKMLTSDRVVMHVDGPPPELLVGAVYDRYEADAWTSTRDESRAPVVAKTTDATTRIRVSRTARIPRGTQSRFFLPPGTCRFGTLSGKASVDGFGVARPSSRDDLAELAVLSEADAQKTRTSCEPALSQPPPADEDLLVPPALRRELLPIASSWLEGEASPSEAEAVAVFARRLRSFGYSLSVRRSPRVDPVLDLLTIHREGHCEMFSAALALLARSRGIPARVVTGYRVSETNPFTGVSVVRERNAHAWVIAWVDGRWVTVDPTPAAELAGRPRPTFLEHVWDAAATEVDRLWAALLVTDPVTLGLGFVGLALAFLAARRAIEAWKRRIPRDDAASAEALAAWDELERALAAAGLPRKPSEPIEGFARRVAAGSEGWSADAAEGILRYADLRYGGHGAERDVGIALETLAHRITSTAP